MNLHDKALEGIARTIKGEINHGTKRTNVRPFRHNFCEPDIIVYDKRGNVKSIHEVEAIEGTGRKGKAYASLVKQGVKSVLWVILEENSLKGFDEVRVVELQKVHRLIKDGDIMRCSECGNDTFYAIDEIPLKPWRFKCKKCGYIF